MSSITMHKSPVVTIMKSIDTAKSNQGVSIAFLNSTNSFKGWKTIFMGQNACVKYNTVDFGKEKQIAV